MEEEKRNGNPKSKGERMEEDKMQLDVDDAEDMKIKERPVKEKQLWGDNSGKGNVRRRNGFCKSVKGYGFGTYPFF